MEPNVDTEKQVEEQVKNAVNANAAPAQSTESKNDAEVASVLLNQQILTQLRKN